MSKSITTPIYTLLSQAEAKKVFRRLLSAYGKIADIGHWVTGHWEIRRSDGTYCFCAEGACMYKKNGEMYKEDKKDDSIADKAIFLLNSISERKYDDGIMSINDSVNKDCEVSNKAEFADSAESGGYSWSEVTRNHKKVLSIFRAAIKAAAKQAGVVDVR